MVVFFFFLFCLKKNRIWKCSVLQGQLNLFYFLSHTPCFSRGSSPQTWFCLFFQTSFAFLPLGYVCHRVWATGEKPVWMRTPSSNMNCCCIIYCSPFPSSSASSYNLFIFCILFCGSLISSDPGVSNHNL